MKKVKAERARRKGRQRRIRSRKLEKKIYLVGRTLGRVEIKNGEKRMGRRKNWEGVRKMTCNKSFMS
jgi:hypothetical protein